MTIKTLPTLTNSNSLSCGGCSPCGFVCIERCELAPHVDARQLDVSFAVAISRVNGHVCRAAFFLLNESRSGFGNDFISSKYGELVWLVLKFRFVRSLLDERLTNFHVGNESYGLRL